jgi:hypothetical protein
MKHLSKATGCDGFGEKETIKWRDVGSVLEVARPEGFEPPTLCLEGRRSFQLSYGRLIDSKRFRVLATIHLLPSVSNGVNPHFETVSGGHTLDPAVLYNSCGRLRELLHLLDTSAFVGTNTTGIGNATRNNELKSLAAR